MSSPGPRARRRAPGAHRARPPDAPIGGLRSAGQPNGQEPEVPTRGGDPPQPPAVPTRGGDPPEPSASEARPAAGQDGPAKPPAGESSPAGPSLVRSSGVMAVGTLASRVTGMVRTVLLVPALGVVALGNSYNYANTLPNTVYNLAIGGILTSIIVPLLVNAARRDRDRSEEYDQRMFTLVTVALAVLTLGATLVAGPIALLYDPTAVGPERHLLVIFAYFFAPQIFFYGVSSLAGAILNARGHFAAPMWTPVVNNVVVIAVTIAFMAIAGVSQVVANGYITSGEVAFLGVGTTLGIVAQTAALVPALRKVGFRWRPRFDFRRREISEIGRMSGWMLGYVLTTQVAFLVTSQVASTADNWAQAHHYKVGIGYSAYSNAWLLFQLPYAIIAISVITALLPRMSANASDRRYDLVRADFSTGIRLGSVIVAPAALVLAVLGPWLAEILLGYGDTSIASARYLGLVFSVFSLGLMPYMLFQLLLRVLYALHDSKTAALIGVVTMVTNVAANLTALAVFPKTSVVAALGAGFGLSNLVGAILAWRILSRRLGGLAGRQIGGSLLRMHLAAVPAVLCAASVVVMISRVFPAGHAAAAAIVVLGGGGAVAFYVLFASALRVEELTGLLAMVRSRLGR